MNAHVRTIARPDGRCLVRCDGSWTAAAATEAVTLARTLRLPALAHVDGDALDEQAILVEAGFIVSRREVRAVIQVEPALEALGSGDLPANVVVRSAADVDEDQLRRLDDELRSDVPGTSGWASTRTEFRAHTFDDPAFDPRTYLVALDRSSSELLGLVRVWMNPQGPRLGMLGVLRGQRRRGIASALLARAFAAVLAAGKSEVATEFDVENDASRALAEYLGATHVGATVELVYSPKRRTGVVQAPRREEQSRVAR